MVDVSWDVGLRACRTCTKLASTNLNGLCYSSIKHTECAWNANNQSLALDDLAQVYVVSWGALNEVDTWDRITNFGEGRSRTVKGSAS